MATGTELMLIEEAQDDEEAIMSAEEGEQERARLADRYLAVQVCPLNNHIALC